MDLERLPRRLIQQAHRHGINEVDVAFDVSSVLAIRTTPATAAQILDTVLVQLTARGEFRSVGRWLDDLEQCADFLTWRSCHWQPGAPEGVTEVSGRAQFRVILTVAEAPRTAGR
jgi:hypothetical protein